MRFSVALMVFCFHYASATLTNFTFEQKLDHFNVSDTRIFQQRYWVNDDYWNRTEKAPVFLFLGLGTAFKGSDLNWYGVFAPALIKHKALGVGIENRYYGRSLSADMLKTEMLKYHTFEQSLEDTKTIQDAIRKNYSIPKLQWISFGASYSGLKSVVHRLTMPDRVFAAFASSAPVNFQFDMPNYIGHIGEVILDAKIGGSQACFDNVRTAFAKVDNLLKSNQLDVLRKDFNFCPTPNVTDDKEKYAIARQLSSLILVFTQQSFINEAHNPYAGICLPFTREGVDPYEVLKRIQWESSPANCSTVSYKTLLDDLNKWSTGISDWNEYDRNPSGRAWGYEICNNIGFNNAYCDTDDGCPLSSYLSQMGQIAQCQDAFEITEQQMRSNNAKFLEKYGGANPQTTRLLLTHGAVDCSYPYEANATIENKEIYSFTASFVGHAADIYPQQDSEPKALYEMRIAVAQVLEKWVGEAKKIPDGSAPIFLSSITVLFVVLFNYIF